MKASPENFFLSYCKNITLRKKKNLPHSNPLNNFEKTLEEPMMKMEEINKFVEEPSMEKLEKFRKRELIEIGKKLELEVRRSMRKSRLIRTIAEHMVHENIFEVEILEDLPTKATTKTPEQMELEKNRIQAKLELKKARLKQETRRRKLDLVRTMQRDEHLAFEISKQARHVPKFVKKMKMNILRILKEALWTWVGQKNAGQCCCRQCW